MRTQNPLLFVALLAVGCDGSAAPGFAPSLAEVHGTVLSASGPPAAAPRAAIVWRAVEVDLAKLFGEIFGAPIEGSAYEVRTSTADAPLVPAFPAAFRIRIVDPPPTDATLDLEAALALSFGAIAFYDDVDGDERLSLEAAGQPGADRVLGAADMLVVFVENRDPRIPTGDPDPTGFHLVRVAQLVPPPPCGVPPPREPSMPLLPIDTPVDVALDGQPLPPGLCPPPPLHDFCTPMPGDRVTCNAEGSGWLRVAPALGATCPPRPPCTIEICPPPVMRPAFCEQ